MSVPTVTIDEVSNAFNNPATDPTTKKVVGGILNDFMDLQYGSETPYTTGKRVLPAEVSIDEVDKAAADGNIGPKFKAVFEKISVTHKSGDFTPQSISDGTWDSKLTPVLVVVTNSAKRSQ